MEAKPNEQSGADAPRKNAYVGFAKRYDWNENAREKSYLVAIPKKEIQAMEADAHGNVKIGIKSFRTTVPGEKPGDERSEINHKPVVNFTKDDFLEAVVHLKKEALLAAKGKGEYEDVSIVIQNRNPQHVSKDKSDLVAFENPIEQGMSKEDRVAASKKEKNYLGGGWTQRPELFKLNPEAKPVDEFMNALRENHSVKGVALIQQHAKDIFKKGNMEGIKEALDAGKERYGEKFNRALDSAVTEHSKKEVKEQKPKGPKI